MTAREKPAPLVWMRDGALYVATLGERRAIVWPVVGGGDYPWRSQVTGGRVVSHFTRDGATKGAEKRLRKAGA